MPNLQREAVYVERGTDMNYIPDWNKKNLRCYLCDETRNVKYEWEIFDPVIDDSKPTKVCVCSKCALRYVTDTDTSKRSC